MLSEFEDWQAMSRFDSLSPAIEETRDLFYTEAEIDRLAEKRADRAFVAGQLSDPTSVLLPVWRGQNLIDETGNAPAASGLTVEEAGDLMADQEAFVLLGRAAERTYFAVDVSSYDEPGDIPELSGRGTFRNLRDVGSAMSQSEGALLAFGRGIFAWHETHGFCPRCGEPSKPRDAGHRRQCTGCEASQYPRVDPAVIMLVRRGDCCLLGHNKRRPAKWFSCFAGFVEIGETLEEAVAREVEEEAGVKVTGVKYFASQPWPFPSSLMLGYFADSPEGEPVPDMEEIVEARWFTKDEVRNIEDTAYRLPPPDSMARQLMAAWVEGRD